MNDAWWELIGRLFRFGLVGGSGMIIDFLVTFALKEKLSANRYLASSMGFTLAATSNYFLNRWWTFSNTNPNVPLQYATFVAVALVGLALSNLLIGLFHGRWGWNFYVAKLLSIGFVMIWNFSANSVFTFG